MDLLHCDKPSCKYNKVRLPCKYAAYRQQQHMPVLRRLPNALCTARGIRVSAAIILDCFATQEDPHTGTKSCRITCCQASQIGSTAMCDNRCKRWLAILACAAMPSWPDQKPLLLSLLGVCLFGSCCVFCCGDLTWWLTDRQCDCKPWHLPYLGVNRYLALQAVKASLSTMLTVDNMRICTFLNNVAQHFLQLATLGTARRQLHVLAILPEIRWVHR